MLLSESTNTSARLASELYTNVDGIHRIMVEFSMPQVDVSKLDGQNSLYWMMRVYIHCIYTKKMINFIIDIYIYI